LGYKLERRNSFEIPKQVYANNFYRGHSQISKKIIKRKYKGPLYNEAGRICIDLTEKYVELDEFKMQTSLTDMKYQLNNVQN